MHLLYCSVDNLLNSKVGKVAEATKEGHFSHKGKVAEENKAGLISPSFINTGIAIEDLE